MVLRTGESVEVVVEAAVVGVLSQGSCRRNLSLVGEEEDATAGVVVVIAVDGIGGGEQAGSVIKVST